MDFLTLAQKRVSCRSFDPRRPVPQEVLRTIAEAGRAAPSAANRQPWKFLFISSPELLEQVRSCYAREWLKSAPHILAVTGSRAKAWVRKDGYNSLETDLTIAMDHMILAAEDLGVSTCWIAAFAYEKLRSVLNLGEDEEIFAITPLGYSTAAAGAEAQKKRFPLEEVAEFI
jgi:nitroreductase